MIQTILGFFGYSKIPLAAVQLSIFSEDLISSLLDNAMENGAKEKTIKHVGMVLEGQKRLTEFLRSGKLLQ